ncbi:hypothetical protein L596_016363 [Steinernema carpocapsae]|uniref:Aquaporin n=1 Tax=Steinernema carpocapsae TaxID=34508 RepID=A0A4V6A3F3_STECR|nr:hypothetical protein L596_016363 [Steinernema carpocapsae]
MLETDIDFGPMMIAVTYYCIVFIVAELTRNLVDRMLKKGGNAYIFAMEAIATAQMCTCVYENGVMIKHYGVMGFFFTVTSLLFVGASINRGAFVSPLAPIEMYYYKTITLKKLVITLVAEAVGGYSAFRIARSLWYYSMSLSSDHELQYAATTCALAYKLPFAGAVAFEIIGCFLMKLIINRIPVTKKQYIVPIVISSFLSFALVYVGVPGLNPTVASSRLQGCHGLTTQWFLFTYWLCPAVGWMAAAHLDRRSKAKSSKKKK